MILRRVRPTPRLRTSSWWWRCSIHATLSWSRSSTNVIRGSSCNIQGRRDAVGTPRGSGPTQNTYQNRKSSAPRVAPASLAAAELDPSLPDDERRPSGETASGTMRVGGPPQTVFSLRFNSFFYKGSHQDLRRCVFISGGADGGAGGGGGASEANKQNKRNLAS